MQLKKIHVIGRLLRRALVASIAVMLSACNWVQLLSVSSDGEQGDRGSFEPAISADGRYVAYQSSSENLVPGDSNHAKDIFLHDLLSGTTTRVSVDSNGAETSSQSYNPSISADGRYVAFDTDASDLVVGDTNNLADVFVRDTLYGTTTRVSVSSAEAQGNDSSFEAALSGDGRFVAFRSRASNLAGWDVNGDYDIFVRDTLGDTTARVSVSSAEAQANSDSYKPSISGDGRYVAFYSRASNLIAGDTNDAPDIFVRDTQLGNTIRVNVGEAEAEANNYSLDPAISSDGRFVAFVSTASNLVAGDSNGVADVFVRDILTGTTTRVSVDDDGLEGDGESYSPSISGDGRYVAFVSVANNLVPGAGGDGVFVRDTLAGTTTRVSMDAHGVVANGNGGAPSVSADGRYVVFETGATNLVPNDLNGSNVDIVIRALPVVTVTSITPNQLHIGANTSVTISGANFLPGAILSLGDTQLSNIVVVDENTIIADVAVGIGEAAGTQDVLVALPGTGPGQFTGVVGECIECFALVTAPGC